LKATIARIKTVLATKDFGAHLNHYLFEPNLILASDGRMTAAVETPLQINCLVPGPELEAILNRFPEDVAMAMDGDKLTIKAGRLRGAIATLPIDSVQFYRPRHSWNPPPKGLLSALRTARPFIAEAAVQPWALTAALSTGYVTATNNICIIRVECQELSPTQEILLPAAAIDFILKSGDDLDGVIFEPDYAGFRWASGLWFRTQLMEGTFPPTIAKILAEPERAITKIDPPWLKEYAAVADLSENIISISRTRIVGGYGKAVVEAAIETDIDEVHFNPKFLSPVLAAAEFWQPSVYPAPVPFRGVGFSGVVLGRRA
jgi:hypothetical protein